MLRQLSHSVCRMGKLIYQRYGRMQTPRFSVYALIYTPSADVVFGKYICTRPMLLIALVNHQRQYSGLNLRAKSHLAWYIVILNYVIFVKIWMTIVICNCNLHCRNRIAWSFFGGTPKEHKNMLLRWKYGLATTITLILTLNDHRRRLAKNIGEATKILGGQGVVMPTVN